MTNSIMSPAGFGLILFCFLFTFIEVDCGGSTIAKIQGIDLALDGSPKLVGMLANEELMGEEMGMENSMDEGAFNFWALIAFLAAAAGLGLYFLIDGKKYVQATAAAGIIAALCLLMLRFTFGSDIDGEAEEMIELDYKFPFWIALLVSLGLGISSFMKLREDSGPSYDPGGMDQTE